MYLDYQLDAVEVDEVAFKIALNEAEEVEFGVCGPLHEGLVVGETEDELEVSQERL